jgi:hypothetical protein
MRGWTCAPDCSSCSRPGRSATARCRACGSRTRRPSWACACASSSTASASGSTSRRSPTPGATPAAAAPSGSATGPRAGATRSTPALGKRLCEAIARRCADNEARVLAALRGEHGERGERRREDPRGRGHQRARAGRAGERGVLYAEPVRRLRDRVQVLLRAVERRPAAAAARAVSRRRGAPTSTCAATPRRCWRASSPTRTRPLLPIKFCPVVSDPYQAVERQAGVTRGCLDVIAAADRPGRRCC